MSVVSRLGDDIAWRQMWAAVEAAHHARNAGVRRVVEALVARGGELILILLSATRAGIMLVSVHDDYGRRRIRLELSNAGTASPFSHLSAFVRSSKAVRRRYMSLIERL